MSLKNRSFTNEQFLHAIKNNYSIAGVLRELLLKPAGANYKTFNMLSKQLNADTSHFTGKGHLKGKTRNWGKIIPLDEFLTENSHHNPGHLKKRLVKENRIIYQCSIQECEISNWKGAPISLHLDHINGDSSDNRLINLRLLCPNCHSQTSTYCGKNIRRRKRAPVIKRKATKKINKKCCDCNKKIDRKATRCKSCAGKHIQPTKISWPPLDDLILMINTTNYSAVGRKLKVSDSAVRQRVKRHSK